MINSIYLIGSLRNPEIPKIANLLRLTGYDVFDDWFSAGPEADDRWKEYSQARGEDYKTALEGYAATHVFDFDKYHLDRCDAAILVYPAGRSCGIEFGYAIGQGKPGWVLLDSPDRWDVMVQFATGWHFDIDGLIDALASYRDNKESS